MKELTWGNSQVTFSIMPISIQFYPSLPNPVLIDLNSIVGMVFMREQSLPAHV
jgi:hypothetical protein